MLSFVRSLDYGEHVDDDEYSDNPDDPDYVYESDVDDRSPRRGGSRREARKSAAPKLFFTFGGDPSEILVETPSVPGVQ